MSVTFLDDMIHRIRGMTVYLTHSNPNGLASNYALNDPSLLCPSI